MPNPSKLVLSLLLATATIPAQVGDGASIYALWNGDGAGLSRYTPGGDEESYIAQVISSAKTLTFRPGHYSQIVTGTDYNGIYVSPLRDDQSPTMLIDQPEAGTYIPFVAFDSLHQKMVWGTTLTSADGSSSSNAILVSDYNGENILQLGPDLEVQILDGVWSEREQLLYLLYSDNTEHTYLGRFDGTDLTPLEALGTSQSKGIDLNANEDTLYYTFILPVFNGEEDIDNTFVTARSISDGTVDTVFRNSMSDPVQDLVYGREDGMLYYGGYIGIWRLNPQTHTQDTIVMLSNGSLYAIALDLANRRPVAISDTIALNLVEGQAVSFRIDATDPDGDSLLCSVLYEDGQQINGNASFYGCLGSFLSYSGYGDWSADMPIQISDQRGGKDTVILSLKSQYNSEPSLWMMSNDTTYEDMPFSHSWILSAGDTSDHTLLQRSAPVTAIMNLNDTNATCLNTESVIYQTFTVPDSLDQLIALRIYLGSELSPMLFELHEGSAQGPIVWENLVGNIPSSLGWVEIPFAFLNVSLTPGNTYTLTIRGPDGYNYTAYCVQSGDSYPDGQGPTDSTSGLEQDLVMQVFASGGMPSWARDSTSDSYGFLLGTPGWKDVGTHQWMTTFTDLSYTKTYLWKQVVEAVNDAPVFTLAPVSRIHHTRTPQISVTLPDWLVSSIPGDSGELSQVLTWESGVLDSTVFEAAPVLDPASGELSFTPSADASGLLQILIRAKDDGDTLHGGVDSSDWDTLDVVFNTPPLIQPIPDTSMHAGDTLAIPVSYALPDSWDPPGSLGVRLIHFLTGNSSTGDDHYTEPSFLVGQSFRAPESATAGAIWVQAKFSMPDVVVSLHQGDSPFASVLWSDTVAVDTGSVQSECFRITSSVLLVKDSLYTVTFRHLDGSQIEALEDTSASYTEGTLYVGEISEPSASLAFSVYATEPSPGTISIQDQQNGNAQVIATPTVQDSGSILLQVFQDDGVDDAHVDFTLNILPALSSSSSEPSSSSSAPSSSSQGSSGTTVVLDSVSGDSFYAGENTELQLRISLDPGSSPEAWTLESPDWLAIRSETGTPEGNWTVILSGSPSWQDSGIVNVLLRLSLDGRDTVLSFPVKVAAFEPLLSVRSDGQVVRLSADLAGQALPRESYLSVHVIGSQSDSTFRLDGPRVLYPFQPGDYDASFELRRLADDSVLTMWVRPLSVRAPDPVVRDSSTWYLTGFGATSMAVDAFDPQTELFTWNDLITPTYGSDRYIRRNQMDSTAPGMGYWYWSSEADSMTMPLLDSAAAVEMALAHGATGWNMVANPWNWPIRLPDDLIFFRWSAQLKDYRTTSVLLPWEGAWVQVDSSRTLRLDPSPTLDTANATPSAARRIAYAGPTQWRISAALQSTGLADAENAFGVSSHALSGKDRLDVGEPPGRMGDFVSLSFFSDGQELSTDMQPASSNGNSWPLVLRSNKDRTASLALDGTAALNAAGWSILVSTQEEGLREYLSSPLPVALSSGEQRARILVIPTTQVSFQNGALSSLRASSPHPGQMEITLTADPTFLGETIVLEAYDLYGRRVFYTTAQVQSGTNRWIVDNLKTTPGIGIIRVRSGSTQLSCGTLFR